MSKFINFSKFQKLPLLVSVFTNEPSEENFSKIFKFYKISTAKISVLKVIVLRKSIIFQSHIFKY